jgi:hypothetical protein
VRSALADRNGQSARHRRAHEDWESRLLDALSPQQNSCSHHLEPPAVSETKSSSRQLVYGAHISIGETVQAAKLKKLASVSLKPVHCSQTQCFRR